MTPRTPEIEAAIRRTVSRLARDPQPVEIRMSKVDAMLIAQNILIACRHPEHATMGTHQQVRDLAENILRVITVDDPDGELFVQLQLEEVP